MVLDILFWAIYRVFILYRCYLGSCYQCAFRFLQQQVYPKHCHRKRGALPQFADQQRALCLGSLFPPTSSSITINPSVPWCFYYTRLNCCLGDCTNECSDFTLYALKKTQKHCKKTKHKKPSCAAFRAGTRPLRIPPQTTSFFHLKIKSRKTLNCDSLLQDRRALSFNLFSLEKSQPLFWGSEARWLIGGTQLN